MSNKSLSSWGKATIVAVTTVVVASIGYWWYSSKTKQKAEESKPSVKTGILLGPNEEEKGFQNDTIRFPSFAKVGIAPVLISFTKTPNLSNEIHFYQWNLHAYLLYPLDKDGYPGVGIYFALRDETVLCAAASASEQDIKAHEDSWNATSLAIGQTIKRMMPTLAAWTKDERIRNANFAMVQLSEDDIPSFSSVSCIPRPSRGHK